MRWRAALTDAANLSGWDLRTKADGHEANFIRMIIQEISKFINNTDLKVAENEIGIDSRMKDIISLLDVEATHDVRIVGICGMGGIGKTTVAMALYNKFRQSFEASSFVADVRETMKTKGMVTLQESLLSDISKTSMTQVGHVAKGVNLIKNRLGCRRVFVVIDNVDDVEQLKALATDRGSFVLGSRVLVTTRDEHLLKQIGVDSIYQARVMEKEEALKLFNLHAFKTHCPNEEYLQLSRRVVDCCGGLPLALKVLGSFLVDRSTSFWESEIKKLQTIPPLEVQEKLKISFDGLKDEERDIFLDISCFFIGEKIDHVKEILDSCDLFPDSGIEVLIQRCLVTVDEYNDSYTGEYYKLLMMHDLLRDMGREIVRANCRDNPGKWSRVWRWEDAEEVLRDKSGSDEIQGFTVRRPHAGISTIETKAFAKMKRLKFLSLSHVELTGGYKYLPNKLRCLDWHGSPLKIIPKDWSLGEAGAIYLQFSRLRYVWKDSRVLAKLKILDLSYSFSLKHTPDFSTIPNLEKLVLINCHRLADVHQSIGGLERLSLVNLQQCIRLEELPRSFYKLKSLVTLDLNDCRRFKKLGEEIGDMTSLSILRAAGTGIAELPSSIVRLKNLQCLYLHYSDNRSKNRLWWGYSQSVSQVYYRNLILPSSVQGLSSLVDLFIINIPIVPEDLGSLISLQRLVIESTNFQSMPSLRGLSQLVYLELRSNLTDKLIKDMDLGSLYSLNYLNLSSNNFTSLPSLCSLSKLDTLYLSSCTNLVAIPELPSNLIKLWADECTVLKIMPDFSYMYNIREMTVSDCAKLIEVSGLDKSCRRSMRQLRMGGCTNITTTVKEKILQGWNFIGGGGIILPLSDIPAWFEWVNKGGRINFQVPENRGSNVIAITLCSTNLHGTEVFVTNHSKLTTFSVVAERPVYCSSDYLWLGHIPNYKLNLEGGDLVEISIRDAIWSSPAKESGVSIVWDTQLPDFRVDTELVDWACFFLPYEGNNNLVCNTGYVNELVL